jgi:hypothetical protein
VPSGLDKLWVADITYVRLLEEFAYLAVVFDAFMPAAMNGVMFPDGSRPAERAAQGLLRERGSNLNAD